MPETLSESAHHRPAGPLDGLVDAYDGYRQRGVAPARHLGLPSPHLTVILTLEEPLELSDIGVFTTLVGGLHVTPVEIVHQGAQSGVQISVSPLASRALFGAPAGELAGLDLPGEEVLGSAATQLWEQLAGVGDWPARFALLDAALSRRISAAGPVVVDIPASVRAAWARLNVSGGTETVAVLAREVGWSERQLEKAFAREIGMTPKQAGRVIRFDRARRTLQARARSRREALDLARLAADCGYHDQSHMIRDFRAFTGLAPTRWLAQEFGNVQVGTVVAA